MTPTAGHMSAFLRACLRWLECDPDQALATLMPHWPDPRPSGRPAHRPGATRGAGTH
ncbi:MAG: hypothetical protein JO272_01120 [Pseudonocardiales bacterium]|nr:hypothetical protein [Pseudonocardiales bacterium]